MSPPEESNGRFKLTLGQALWAVGLLSTLLGTWYDTRNQMALQAARLEGRITALEITVTDANAQRSQDMSELRDRVYRLEHKGHQ